MLGIKTLQNLLARLILLGLGQLGIFNNAQFFKQNFA